MLRFVDAWACRAGTPEDEEDERSARAGQESGTSQVKGFGVESGSNTPEVEWQMPAAANNNAEDSNNNEGWIELDVHEPRLRDEEAGTA